MKEQKRKLYTEKIKTMKTPEEMNERELMIETLRNERINAKYQTMAGIGCLVLAVIVTIAFAIIMPRAIHTLEKVNTTLTQANTTLSQIETTMSKLETTVDQAQVSLDQIDEAVRNVNTLVEDNTDILNNTIKDISEIDFKTLNDSIQDLNRVIQPLSRFFSR